MLFTRTVPSSTLEKEGSRVICGLCYSVLYYLFVVRYVIYEGAIKSGKGEQKQNWQAESRGCANLKVCIVLNMSHFVSML
jgi:hypothetical protein